MTMELNTALEQLLVKEEELKKTKSRLEELAQSAKDSADLNRKMNLMVVDSWSEKQNLVRENHKQKQQIFALEKRLKQKEEEEEAQQLADAEDDNFQFHKT